ncbi:MAG: response regulator [Candidatus Omnitrophica bacterium]|nr:response regulator [Candidatus Omnitrophota bacterium]
MVKVLLIEDSESFKKYIVPYLKAKGFGVVLTSTGEDGVKMFNADKYDAVILDLGLPDIDGAEVYLKLKEIDPDVPVGILSGYGGRERELLLLGVKAFFEKPIMVPELEKWINGIVTK